MSSKVEGARRLRKSRILRRQRHDTTEQVLLCYPHSTGRFDSSDRIRTMIVISSTAIITLSQEKTVFARTHPDDPGLDDARSPKGLFSGWCWEPNIRDDDYSSRRSVSVGPLGMESKIDSVNDNLVTWFSFVCIYHSS